MARMNYKGEKQPRNVGFFVYGARIANVPACNHLQLSGNMCVKALWTYLISSPFTLIVFPR